MQCGGAADGPTTNWREENRKNETASSKAKFKISIPLPPFLCHPCRGPGIRVIGSVGCRLSKESGQGNDFREGQNELAPRSCSTGRLPRAPRTSLPVVASQPGRLCVLEVPPGETKSVAACRLKSRRYIVAPAFLSAGGDAFQRRSSGAQEDAAWRRWATTLDFGRQTRFSMIVPNTFETRPDNFRAAPLSDMLSGFDRCSRVPCAVRSLRLFTWFEFSNGISGSVMAGALPLGGGCQRAGFISSAPHSGDAAG